MKPTPAKARIIMLQVREVSRNAYVIDKNDLGTIRTALLTLNGLRQLHAGLSVGAAAKVPPGIT
jgi:hypothetical protein